MACTKNPPSLATGRVSNCGVVLQSTPHRIAENLKENQNNFGAPSAFAEAAREYRVNYQKPPRRDKPSKAMSAVQREALITEIFDATYDANRATIAALVALGAHDLGVARHQYGMLITDTRIIARLWDKLEAGGAE